MEPIVPHKKLESGVFQGRPEIPDSKKVAPPRLIRTMKLDMAEAVKNQNETVVSIAIAEEKKKAVARAEGMTATQTGPENLTPAPKPVGRIVVIFVILLIALLLGLAYVFVLPKLGAIKLPDITIPSFGKPVDTTTATTTDVVVLPLASSLIRAQTEKRFSITNQTRTQVFNEILIEMRQGLPSGSIKNLYFTEGNADLLREISSNRLFIFADVSAPEILTRSLEKPFMMGFWGEQNGDATPFLILKVSGNDTGFAGMLEWEANLPRFFDTIFGTSIEVGITSKIKFKDIVVLGKDARTIDTPFGGSVSYAFANQNTIVIAGSKTSLEALLPLASKN